MSYSTDFRDLVLDKISSGMTWSDACKTFSISRGSIAKWLKNKQDNGTSSDSSRKAYKPKKIEPALLIAAFEKTPDATLEEISKEFNCWPQSIQKRCVKLGLTRKKNDTIR